MNALHTLLASNIGLLLTSCVIFGLIFGSFLNVVILRLPKRLEFEWKTQCQEFLELNQPDTESSKPVDLVFTPSHCPKCGHKLKIWENIPLFSWLFLRGKCSECKTPISIQYPLVEFLTAASAAWLAWHFGYSFELLAALIFTFFLIALSGIDFHTQLLPDNLTYPLLWLGLLYNLTGGFVSLDEAVIGAVAGYLSLWSVYQAFKLLTGKEGMGYGDFKLLAALGAWLGWKMLPLIIIFSAISGLVIALLLMVFLKHKRETPIPFGPYLAIAGWIALNWGTDLLNAYLDYSGL